MRSHRRCSRFARLAVESLEGREVPAGAITANLVHGKLTITGDDQANGLTLLVGANSVTVTPDGSTAVNGQPAGTAVVLQGAATSLSASLGGGADSLAIDGAADFVLTGAAAVDLGDGDNTLNLATTGKIQLGSLTVKAGDGTDSAAVSAGVGLGSVAGNASFDFGLGGSIVAFTNMAFHGPAGLKVAVSKVSGSMTLNADSVTVDKGVSIAAGNSYSGATFDSSVIGGLTLTGFISDTTLTATTVKGNVSAVTGFQNTLELRNSTVNGNVAVKGNFQSELDAADATVNGNVSTSGSFGDTVDLKNTTVNGAVSLKGGLETSMTVSGATISGDVSVVGGFEAQLYDNGSSGSGNGTFSANNVTVTSNEVASVNFRGAGSKATIGGNLIVAGKLASTVDFSTPTVSEVAGNVTVKGGSIESSIQTNQFFKADQDVTVKLGNGVNLITIGNGSAPVPILGNLSITTGSGTDEVDLENVAVGKNTTISLGAGADILTIDRGTSFAGTFSADTGAGDDTIAIAQATGSAAPVTFTGKATITAGDGNDTLLLGLATGGPGGDANSKAVFNGTGNKIDGGTGFNTFDGLTPGQSPSQYTGLTAANFLNWTDPNP